MSSSLNYLVDGKGHKTNVLVPVKTWDNLNGQVEKLNKKLSILTGIQEGIAEVRNARAQGKTLQSLSDFLSESQD